MPRDEEVQYEQDRFGNERRKLSELQAAEGQVADEGIEVIDSGETGSALAVLSSPTRADEIIVTEVWGFNSGPAADNTFHLIEGEPDGNGFLSNTTRRSVDIVVGSEETRREPYSGRPFTASIGVVSDFAGQVAVGVAFVHKESSD